jgi:preprotein translocase subunit SecE
VNDGEFPSLLAMIGIVAVVVAVVILVFFGIGYLIGRLVL